jgi:hypothetical protein
VDDVMNVSGHRISTLEVESALVDHRAEGTGQAITAFVTLKGTVTGDETLPGEIRDHVAKRISSIAKPASIVLTAELPKARSGKIMQRLLRDISERRWLGYVTTLANAAVVEEIAELAKAARPTTSAASTGPSAAQRKPQPTATRTLVPARLGPDPHPGPERPMWGFQAPRVTSWARPGGSSCRASCSR